MKVLLLLLQTVFILGQDGLKYGAFQTVYDSKNKFIRKTEQIRGLESSNIDC